MYKQFVAYCVLISVRLSIFSFVDSSILYKLERVLASNIE